MKAESYDQKQGYFDVQQVKLALHKLQDEGAELDPAGFDLFHFLDTNGLLQPQFAINLPKWPTSIQTYIKKELLEYVRSNKEFEQEDLEIVGGFLETALQETENCGEGQILSMKWERAMKALALELRRYYGSQENDEELPCWRR